ncbi:hypothetical protein SELMODRAFT_412961 [Selaginella moellendorffii]|uniref:Uncharacterized protein n=1 Tax=Selaginella moellendorffii TaxID=88036 RepID=D8RMX0_SELML|nr:hypothetical protein SELMODRAFT_412961 [Selaginella moellendorffii]
MRGLDPELRRSLQGQELHDAFQELRHGRPQSSRVLMVRAYAPHGNLGSAQAVYTLVVESYGGCTCREKANRGCGGARPRGLHRLEYGVRMVMPQRRRRFSTRCRRKNALVAAYEIMVIFWHRREYPNSSHYVAINLEPSTYVAFYLDTLIKGLSSHPFQRIYLICKKEKILSNERKGTISHSPYVLNNVDYTFLDPLHIAVVLLCMGMTRDSLETP